jgi:cytochrome c peroxidase
MRKYFLLVGLIALLAGVQSFRDNKRPSNKAELGKLLFFDPILSETKTVSCATCHKPEFAFADTSALSVGVHSRLGNRNTPSAMNLSLQRVFFWDGRARSLEEQALAPIENPDEMNLSLDSAVSRLVNDKNYYDYFQTIFNAEPNKKSLGEAIAAFERKLETSDSPFDNWKFSEKADAVNEAVKRGFVVFNSKGKCSVCHFGADFTTHEFRNVGLFNGKQLNDSGRAVITKEIADIGKFKVPGLRNVALTAPYMHDGRFRTLREVIDFYNDPRLIVPDNINRDTTLAKPLGLTEQEKSDLEAFLFSLTDRQFNTSKQKMQYPVK